MHHVHPKKFVLFIVCALYFSILLILKVYPALGGTKFFFFYVLSLFAILLILGIVGLWGLLGITIVLILREKVRPHHRSAVIFVLASAFIFASVLILFRALPSPLPSGSDGMPFNPAIWKLPESCAFVGDDITPRQKMLKDVVESLPGKTREEIESLLGPSLDTPYFQSTGRDLIYMLGPQRDSFFGIDSEWLLIWVDGSGRFLKYRIAVD
ncbi:MAG: hypothetical protein P8Y77_01360 [Nitrospirota bacterium]|jgi:hypothetical protein